jgi:hypothetical protein
MILANLFIEVLPVVFWIVCHQPAAAANIPAGAGMSVELCRVPHAARDGEPGHVLALLNTKKKALRNAAAPLSSL